MLTAALAAGCAFNSPVPTGLDSGDPARLVAFCEQQARYRYNIENYHRKPVPRGGMGPRRCVITTTPEWTVYSVTPIYPSAALFGKVEGCVWVEFQVGDDGRPRQPVVVGATKPGTFDFAATDAITHWYFSATVAAPEQRQFIQRICFDLPGGFDVDNVPISPPART